MKYTGRWMVWAFPEGEGPAYPFALVQAQGAPGPLRLAKALSLGTVRIDGPRGEG
jgi:hypothetical protein